jgi:hypothetical protein
MTFATKLFFHRQGRQRVMTAPITTPTASPIMPKIADASAPPTSLSKNCGTMNPITPQSAAAPIRMTLLRMLTTLLSDKVFLLPSKPIGKPPHKAIQLIDAALSVFCAVAVTGGTRFVNLPTVAESGFPG